METNANTAIKAVFLKRYCLEELNAFNRCTNTYDPITL